MIACLISSEGIELLDTSGKIFSCFLNLSLIVSVGRLRIFELHPTPLRQIGLLSRTLMLLRGGCTDSH